MKFSVYSLKGDAPILPLSERGNLSIGHPLYIQVFKKPLSHCSPLSVFKSSNQAFCALKNKGLQTKGTLGTPVYPAAATACLFGATQEKRLNAQKTLWLCLDSYEP